MASESIIICPILLKASSQR